MPSPPHGILARIALATALLIPACSDGADSPPGPTASLPGPDLGPGERPPGLVVEITAVTGASGFDGSFQAGDNLEVEFTVQDRAGQPIAIADLARGAAMVSGPTFRYQRVIASQNDVLERAVRRGPGRYAYSFATPIPAAYLAPFNDTPALTLGELTGAALLSGTYTVGLELRADYETTEGTVRDPGGATADFRFGGASTLEPRDVVSADNCVQCHGELRAHGDNRTDLASCLLCHTAGAEDRNDPDVAGGTPGASIDFQVMIHRIHAGKHLPSVQGVGTAADGSREYAAGAPYRLVGFGNNVHDYSGVGFPAWPGAAAPMPRDVGHGSLPPAAQAAEDAVRSGPVACHACHGDPDGNGPLKAPANGELAYLQPSRTACGSCHDDWVWDRAYTSNRQTMPAQTDDASCVACHDRSGQPLSVVDAHRHPLDDPARTAGLRVDLRSITEAGSHDGDGNLDPGEKVALDFSIEDGDGGPISPADLATVELVISGPTTNPNLLLLTEIPVAALASSVNQQLLAPERVLLEFVGDATGQLGDAFATARTPHWNMAGARTEVWLRSANGAATSLASVGPALQNHIDVATGTGSLFGRDDWVVIDDGSPDEEYLQVQFVDGDRLWFSSPATPAYPSHLRTSHAVGTSVQVVTLEELTEDRDYSLDPVTGSITELAEFGDGTAVLASYTTDFTIPLRYGPTLNDSPTLDASWGEWRGKSLVDGTYTAGLWAERPLTVSVLGERTDYRDASPAATRDFQVGSGTTITPDLGIASPETCAQCHHEVVAHEAGRRGYAGCVLCHSLGGAEDRPRYVAANAPENTVGIDFRSMLHKIHHGTRLDDAGYAVVGASDSGGSYPDNFALHPYGQVAHPITPGGTTSCESCHGEDNSSWVTPPAREHPLDPSPGVRVWRNACASCHDSRSALGHFESNTEPNGAEACALCHGPSTPDAVELVHTPR